MLEALKYNLAHLADFTGREDRSTFWWYVLVLVILDIVLGLIVSGPMVAGSISTAVQAAQSGMSEQAIQAQQIDVLHQQNLALKAALEQARLQRQEGQATEEQLLRRIATLSAQVERLQTDLAFFRQQKKAR